MLNIESQTLTHNQGFRMYMNPKTIKATASHERRKPTQDILDGAQISKFVLANHFFLAWGNVPTGNVQGSRTTSSSLTGVLIKSWYLFIFSSSGFAVSKLAMIPAMIAEERQKTICQGSYTTLEPLTERKNPNFSLNEKEKRGYTLSYELRLSQWVQIFVLISSS